VADDRCTETMIKSHRGRVDVMQLASRHASGGRRIRRLFGRTHGRFRTRGRSSSATVRGKATSG